MDCRLGPYERRGVRIVGGNECIDVLLEPSDRGEGGAGKRLPLQDGKPDLDLIEP